MYEDCKHYREFEWAFNTISHYNSVREHYPYIAGFKIPHKDLEMQ